MLDTMFKEWIDAQNESLGEWQGHIDKRVTLLEEHINEVLAHQNERIAHIEKTYKEYYKDKSKEDDIRYNKNYSLMENHHAILEGYLENFNELLRNK